VVTILVIVFAAGTLLFEGREGPAPALATYGAQASETSSSVWLSPSSSQMLGCPNVPGTSSEVAASSTSSGPLSISIVQATTDPLDSQPGQSVYIYGLNVTDAGPGSYPVNGSSLVIVTSSNATFHVVSVPAVQRSLTPTVLNPGQATEGQVAFQIPASQTPLLLRYSVPGYVTETVSSLPAPIGAVSEPSSVTASIQYPSDIEGFEILNAHPYIQNDTGYFYPGQVIPIVVAFTDSVDGTWVMVNAITSGTAAVSIVQVTPLLPLVINGYSAGINYDELVCAYAPQTVFTGIIVLDISANEW